MHILESAALYSGLKVRSPWINTKIFPVPFDKYILIDTQKSTNGFAFKRYGELISLVNPHLKQGNFGIIALVKDAKIADQRNVKVINSTNLDPRHLASIVYNSELTVTSDELTGALCDFFKIKTVFIGDTETVIGRGPYFSKEVSNIRILLKDKVSEINVEDIYEQILEQLGIENKQSIQSVHTGELYNDDINRIIEVTPEQIISPEAYPENIINIRIDYLKQDLEDFHYKGIFENLKIRKCTIITDRPFKTEVFEPLKSQILAIYYDITNGVDEEFAKNAKLICSKLNFIYTQNPGEDASLLNERKLAVIDFPERISSSKREPIKIKNFEGLVYKSNKFIISNNRTYLSRAALESGSTASAGALEQEVSKIKDNINILTGEDQDCIFIFKKN